MSGLLIHYVLTAAIRDKLLISMILMMVLASSLAIFFGSAAIVEQDQFTIVFAGGALRLIGIMALVLFVVFFMRRSFEGRDVEFLLTRPIGRIEFIISYAAGFMVLAVLMGLAQSLCIYALGPHLFNTSSMLWCFSIIIENMIIVNVALFFAMFFSSAATAAMASFSFYILGRMMGQVLGIIDSSKDTAPEILEFTMQVVSVLMPRIDLMGQTSWLIYGYESGISFPFLIVQGCVFILLVIAAALIDLVSRQF
jgi:hypothetical protein